MFLKRSALADRSDATCGDPESRRPSGELGLEACEQLAAVVPEAGVQGSHIMDDGPLCREVKQHGKGSAPIEVERWSVSGAARAFFEPRYRRGDVGEVKGEDDLLVLQYPKRATRSQVGQDLPHVPVTGETGGEAIEVPGTSVGKLACTPAVVAAYAAVVEEH